MTSHLTDQLRAPPGDIITRHRQELIADELFVLFERLDQLGKQTIAVETRRDRVKSRLSDHALLKNYPEGTNEHTTAINKYAELDLLAGRLRYEIYVLAGKAAYKLKLLHGEHYRSFSEQIGSSYKDEPIWGILRAQENVEQSAEWQDLISVMLRSVDGRPPF